MNLQSSIFDPESTRTMAYFSLSSAFQVSSIARVSHLDFLSVSACHSKYREYVVDCSLMASALPSMNVKGQVHFDGRAMVLEPEVTVTMTQCNNERNPCQGSVSCCVCVCAPALRPKTSCDMITDNKTVNIIEAVAVNDFVVWHCDSCSHLL